MASGAAPALWPGPPWDAEPLAPGGELGPGGPPSGVSAPSRGACKNHSVELAAFM